MRYLYRINHVETGDAIVTATLVVAKERRSDLRRTRGGTVTIVRKPRNAGPDAPWEPLPTREERA